MIRRLREEGLSKSAISRRTGHDRKTIRKYLLMGELKTHKPREVKAKILDPYKDYIKSRLEEYGDMSAVRLLEDIQEQGYPGKYTTVKNYVREIKRNKRIPAEYRYETKPGIQAQVDWSEIDEITVDDAKRRLYCFNMVLGYSRMRYIEFSLDMTTETFIQCHLNAFQYFGGVTKEILYDNTKSVVLHRALISSDSTWNPMFEDFFRHFGFMPRLCKPGKKGAKTKGKVERLIGYVKNNFYLGLEYETVTDLGNHAHNWLEKVNNKPHGTTKVPPYELLKEEKLQAFDEFSPYQIVRTEYRKISRDCYISYMGNLYSVPWQYAGLQAELRIQNRKMQVFVNGKNLCEHVCREGSGNAVRIKEHSEGLLKEKMRYNRARHERHIQSLKVKAPVVERRALVEYDVFMGGDPNE